MFFNDLHRFRNLTPLTKPLTTLTSPINNLAVTVALSSYPLFPHSRQIALFISDMALVGLSLLYGLSLELFSLLLLFLAAAPIIPQPFDLGSPCYYVCLDSPFFL